VPSIKPQQIKNKNKKVGEEKYSSRAAAEINISVNNSG
jgi:hypothetical protein